MSIATTTITIRATIATTTCAAAAAVAVAEMLLSHSKVIFTWAINVSINDILAATATATTSMGRRHQQICCNCCRVLRATYRCCRCCCRLMLQLLQMLLKLAFYVYENGRLTAEAEFENPGAGGGRRGGAVVLEYSLAAVA